MARGPNCKVRGSDDQVWQKNDDVPYAREAAVLYICPGHYPLFRLTVSMKMRQRSFFYVKNIDPTKDCIQLVHFIDMPPTSLNWTMNMESEVLNRIFVRLKEMKSGEGLVVVDL
ncbi:hypothetical protein D1007_35835 [Hordeum vulgare]|nr:hypothetical protein D1007_35835 [Hordeum vulgare]